MEDQAVPANDMPDNMDTSNEVPKSDLPENAMSGQEVPESDLPSTSSEYGTPGQQALTAAEGAARGATFGLSTAAETGLGLATPEEIKAREQENPLIAAGADAAGTIGSMFVPGVGEGWLLGKAAKLAVPIAENASRIAKIGRLALRGLVETAGMATGDEISDALLGKGHDADAVASHIISSGAVGMLTGGLFGAAGEKLKALQDANMGEYGDNFAIGAGSAAEGGTNAADIASIYKEAGLPVPKGMLDGMKFTSETTNQVANKMATLGSEVAGSAAGAVSGVPGGTVLGYKLAQKYIDPYAEKLASRYAPGVSKKVIVPIMIKAIQTGNYIGISNALNYGTKAAKGAQTLNKALDSLFKTGSEKAINFEMSERDNEKLEKYIENGGIDQQIQELQNQPTEMPGYAEGGVVTPKPLTSDGVSHLYPAQHIMLTSAKGRVSNYLNSIRPQPKVGGMIFDKEHKDPLKEKSYKNAIGIANQPLKVLQHIQDGTLQMEHVKHLNSMYPEVHDHMAKKITERLIQNQSDETKPPYKVRQGLSLFLGAPLESLLTPQSIQAAQSTFAPRQAPQNNAQPSPNKPKKGTATLGKSNKTYRTASQDAEFDRTTRD